MCVCAHVCVCVCVRASAVFAPSSSKRCSPFAPKETRRLPPIPWFDHSTTPHKSEDLFPSPMRIDPKSPRSLSVDTPPSSSRQGTFHTLTRCMSMAALNSPEPQAEREDHLIGDESRPYCLPIEKGARPESLKCISPQTVCGGVLLIDNVSLIDVLFPHALSCVT